MEAYENLTTIKGVRIKATYGDTGSVSNIIYDNITLSGITDCGIVIRQDYSNSLGYTGTPTGGIPITNVTLSNIYGSVSSSATNIDIACANCQDWTFDNVTVTDGKTSTDCVGVPSGISC
jgi:polygalacturonase